MPGFIKKTMSATGRFFSGIFKKFRQVRANRNFLVFLVFLGVSILFWFLQSLNETTSITMDYDVVLSDVPDNMICTTEYPKKIQVKFAGRGYSLIKVMLKDAKREIVIDYAELEHDGRISLDNTSLAKIVNRTMPSGIRFESSSPSKLNIYFSNGQKKRVPVIFAGKIVTLSGHYLGDMVFSPDSVDVYAPSNIYNNISSIYTESRTFKNVEDTLVTQLALVVPEGAKVVPSSIQAKFCVDLYTEKKLSVPIFTENIPEDKMLRTFPPTATITFQVGTRMYDKITEDDFMVAVDFSSIKPEDKSCKLMLLEQPKGVRNVRFSPETVEFVIEQDNE